MRTDIEQQLETNRTRQGRRKRTERQAQNPRLTLRPLWQQIRPLNFAIRLFYRPAVRGRSGSHESVEIAPPIM